MSAPFNPGDVLTIATKSACSKFTVQVSNAHRTRLIGARGARRVLVSAGGIKWSLHEDDGDRNRGRPCSVNHVEHATAGPSAAVRFEDDAPSKDVKPAPRHRPITALELATLMRCETPREVAEWVMGRDIGWSMLTHDPHAADNAAAMKLYLASLEVCRLSAEASE